MKENIDSTNRHRPLKRPLKSKDMMRAPITKNSSMVINHRGIASGISKNQKRG